MRAPQCIGVLSCLSLLIGCAPDVRDDEGHGGPAPPLPACGSVVSKSFIAAELPGVSPAIAYDDTQRARCFASWDEPPAYVEIEYGAASLYTSYLDRFRAEGSISSSDDIGARTFRISRDDSVSFIGAMTGDERYAVLVQVSGFSGAFEHAHRLTEEAVKNLDAR